MYLVGGAEHHRIRNCERMRDTLEESGYESDGNPGTFIPRIDNRQCRSAGALAGREE